MDKRTSDYVIVEGVRTRMPPTRDIPPRKPGYFPIMFTVRFAHPSPYSNSSFHKIEKYKTVQEFLVAGDDFTSRERGIASVNRLVDYMSVPFPLHDTQLFWKPMIGNKVGPQEPVDNWDEIVAILTDFLQQATNLVRDEMYPLVKLEITKFEHLPREEFEALRLERERLRADGTWHQMVILEPQMRMERRMAALQAKEMAKFDGDEDETCCICLADMSVASEVARLPCSHHTHRHCILQWLMINNSCPFCRFKIVAKLDTYWLKQSIEQT